MAFFTKKTDKESLKEGGNSKYINKSGLYDITVLVPFMGGTTKSPVVELYIDYDGQKQPLYGNMRITNNDGSENFGAKIFNKLLVIADVDAVADPVEAELPIGKAQGNKSVAILEDLQDIDCKVHIQMEYSINPVKNSIRESTVIKNFYRTDGASAEEIVNETEPGVNLEKSQKYFDNVSYKDGLTEEVVAQWIADKRPEGTAKAAPATKKPSFGSKKFGDK